MWETASRKQEPTLDIWERLGELAPEIRSRAEEAETSRRFPKDLLEKLKEAGVFRALVPQSHGGLELDFPAWLEVVRELARADASAGWIVLIGGSSAIILAKAARETFDCIYASGPDVIQGGLTGFPAGTAERVDGGYILSGRWPFSSGCQHCDWILGAAKVTERGALVQGDAPGSALIRVFALPASEWMIEETWDAVGLRGTGSHHTSLEAHFVPDSQTFDLLGGPPCLPGPLYRHPSALVPLLHGALATGIARGALDDLIEIAGGGRKQLFSRTEMQQSHIFQYELGQLDADLTAAEALLERTAKLVWSRVQSCDDLEGAVNESFRASVWVTQAALKVCSVSFNLAGASAVYTTSSLQRRLRDMNAAAQHALVQKLHYQGIGAVRLGLATSVR
jgi:alkylation response protein AidB-like acyl-CoA dehydrogenase